MFQELLLAVTKLADLLIVSMQDVDFIDDEKAANILYGSYAAEWNLVAQVGKSVHFTYERNSKMYPRNVNQRIPLRVNVH